MVSYSKKFFTVYAIYVTLCSVAAEGVRTQQWTHDFENSVYQQDRSLLTSPGQVYGNCDSAVVHEDHKESEIYCKLAMENADAAIDSPDHVRVCDFTLPKEIHQGNNSYKLKGRLDEIVAIAKNRAVVKFDELSSQTLFVLNFDNCTVANSYTGKDYLSVYAPTKDKFDAIIWKYKSPGVRFRITFDNDGNIISPEKSWFKGETNIIAVADSPTKGRLVIDVINRFLDDSLSPAVRITAMADNGTIENLNKEYPIDERGYIVHQERFAESTTFNLVSLCARSNSTTSMKCSQVDLNGNVKFETDISLDEYSPVHSFRVHNLPRGGLLLFIFKCDETAKPVCVLREESFYVKKINAAGQSVGTLKVNDNHDVLDVDIGAMHVFESDKKEICLSNVRSRSNDWHLTLDVVCLDDNDFSGEITWPNY